jgi:hypothetical protein
VAAAVPFFPFFLETFMSDMQRLSPEDARENAAYADGRADEREEWMPVLEALRGIEVLYRRPDEGWDECFERVAEVFHAETGYLRPGKDCRIHDDAVRTQAWDQWTAAKIAAMREAIEKAGG